MTGRDGSRRLGLFVALLAAVFVAGVAGGVIGDRLLARRPVLRAEIHSDMSHVLDRLDLTSRQRAQADSIVNRQAPRSEAVMMDMAERLGAVADSVDADLRAILTPNQQARLDSLRAEGPQLMLKRKRITPSGTTVDTVRFRRDSAKRSP